MKSKPGVLIFLAFLQAVAPFGNIVLGAVLSEMSISTYLRELPNSQYGYSFLYSLFAVQFFTAFAVYAVKPWSIPVCIAVAVWHISKVPSLQTSWSNPWIVPSLIFCHAMNIAFIFYFLIPAVRKVYFNKRLRWWESIPRYVINGKGVILIKDQAISCDVDEISRVGAFISVKNELHVREELELNFSYDGKEYFLKARVLNQHLTEKKQFGILFSKKGLQTKRDLFLLTQKLEKARVPRIPERVDQFEEFKSWAKQAVKSGRGFLPSYESRAGVVAGSKSRSLVAKNLDPKKKAA